MAFKKLTLQTRGLKSAEELAADRPHGSRLKYMGGCRCDSCRKANSSYESERQKARKSGDWNGIVSADKARTHLEWLSKKGVGRRSVSAASDVGESVIMEIKSGSRKNIRARTERLILAVTLDAAADHALISAKRTWKMIDKLLGWGHTKTELAKLLGYANGALQFGRDTVTVRNEFEVERLFKRLEKERAQRIAADKAANAMLKTKDKLPKDGKPVIVRKKGSVSLPPPASTYAAWGGFR